MKNTKNDKSKSFQDLLKEIKQISDKKKRLWLEIYENAIADRVMSEAFISGLTSGGLGDIDKQITIAPHLQKYLEKMSRANDQLLQLAKLIHDAEMVAKEQSEDDGSDLYDKINK